MPRCRSRCLRALRSIAVKAVRLREPFVRTMKSRLSSLARAWRQREADQSAAVLGHEVDGVGRRHLRRDDEIAFVFAILGIDENDHAAVLHLLDDLFDRRERAAAMRRTCKFVEPVIMGETPSGAQRSARIHRLRG